MNSGHKDVVRCAVCNSALGAPIYVAARNQSLTSLGQVIGAELSIYACKACGHIQNSKLARLQEYYRDDYHVLTANADEDDLYKIEGGSLIFRSAHQLSVLLSKVDIMQGARILDYGCAKAATLRRLVTDRPDIRGHAFDVSDRYVSFWQEFLPGDATATYEVPSAWDAHFDVVTSFFAFEHIDDPVSALSNISRVLKKNGVLYIIVPNALANSADFVVVDHINHFTMPSIYFLLSSAGFVVEDVDNTSHDSAFVVKARNAGETNARPAVHTAIVDQIEQQARMHCAYWANLEQRLAKVEVDLAGRPFSIYGAGFYGRYFAYALRRPEMLQCFLDQNPFVQGKMLLGKPVVSPSALPPEIDDVLVGLNPRIARAATQNVWDQSQKSPHMHYVL
jgi:SAM-dependent methyltransferase